MARNHANFEDASAYTGELGGRIFCCEDRFYPVLFERIPAHTHNKNKSQLDHVSYGMVLAGDVISSLFMVLCWARALSCAVFPSSCRHHHHPSNRCWRFCAREKFEKINQHESWRRRDKRRKNLRITTALPVEDSVVDPTLVAHGGSRSPEDDDTKPWRCPLAIPQETLQATWATKDQRTRRSRRRREGTDDDDDDDGEPKYRSDPKILTSGGPSRRCLARCSACCCYY